VVHRYAVGLAIPGLQDWLLQLNFGWAQELCIIMFVWMAKFGAAYGVRTGIHVGVDVLINRLSEGVRGKFIVFGLLAGALFTGIVGTLGAPSSGRTARTTPSSRPWAWAPGDLFEGPTTPDLEWPTWIVYCGHPVRLGADVLPLPAGGLGLRAHRRAAAPRPRPCRRLEPSR
jgi:C4-dicarboxylate transporter DctQ subunit